MRAVLGIDAAWTLMQPSGVALAVERASGWELMAVAPSYDCFYATAAGALAPCGRPLGTRPDAAALLRSAHSLCGHAVSLVAVDMPLALSPIAGSRPCDIAVSREYGRRKCGVYMPSAVRPGVISDQLRQDFADSGYRLCTQATATPGLIEVYPHTALLALCNAPERLPYKAAKTRTYWPLLDVAQRRDSLYRQWAEIVRCLECEIAGVTDALPPLPATASGVQRKAYEDMLDAVICAWAAIQALQGRAAPLGDADAAIWSPIHPATGISLQMVR